MWARSLLGARPPLMQRFSGPPRPVGRPVSAAVAMVALLVVFGAALVAGVPSSSAAFGQATAADQGTYVGPDTESAPADGFPRVDAIRRAPSVPAAVLAAAVVITGWAVGRRFVPLPRPRVQSWAGGRAGRDRAPPIPAV